MPAGAADRPWTVDDAPTMAALIDRGVDGLITDYPDVGRTVMAQRGLKLPPRHASPFDVEGHRGARAYRPENTIPAFAYALSRGVTTLETDTGVTKDGVLVISHNRAINGVHCHDSAPAFPGRSALPVRRQAHPRPHARRDQDARLRVHRSRLPAPGAGPGADADAAGALRLREGECDLPVRFNIETKISRSSMTRSRTTFSRPSWSTRSARTASRTAR
jgi:glycerophosphoryl diester phosphodiesterase